jgi:hypothetical protein
MKKIVLALTLAAVMPTMAQPLATKHPMAQKYADVGAKPAKGRSGSAAIEARALLSRTSGATQLDLTTASFDSIASAAGSLDKVQVKIFDGDRLVRTDNYKPGDANASIPYAGLVRGERAEVQANVKGNGKGTDVVAVSTQVVLRPDLEASALTAPATTGPNISVPIVGSVSELNGDVGARFDCRLYSDGMKIGEILGAWVDAGSSVNCQFQVSFAQAGAKRLTMTVSGAMPADDDAANNDIAALIDVRAPFAFMEAFLQGWEWDDGTRKRTITKYEIYPDNYTTEEYEEWGKSGHGQLYGASALEPGEHALSGVMSVRHSMDGIPLPPIEVDVGSLPARADGDGTCRAAFLANGVYVNVCSYPTSGTSFYVLVQGGGVTYIPDGYYTLADWVPIGSHYTATLAFEGPDLSRSQTLDASIGVFTYTSFGWSDWGGCTQDVWLSGTAAVIPGLHEYPVVVGSAVVRDTCWMYRYNDSYYFGRSTSP